MNAPLRELPPLIIRTREERAQMALEAALMARDNARANRRAGNETAAVAAFWRAYDYLDMARRWRNGK